MLFKIIKILSVIGFNCQNAANLIMKEEDGRKEIGWVINQIGIFYFYFFWVPFLLICFG